MKETVRYLHILLLTIICSALLYETCLAVPAAPVTHILEQGDGTSVKARQWGDKWSHGWETLEGYTIVYSSQARRWVYASQDREGELKPTLMIAGADRPQRGMKKHIRPTGRSRASSSNMKASSSVSMASMAPPVSGTANIPVILINYSDTSTSFTPAQFDSLLFGSGNSSMKDYYEEVSYGAFSVSAGPGGVAGWYTAANTYTYYGQNDSGGYDMWPGTLVREAVAAADTSFDFAPYDQDGDCYVDVINIVHQGSGEEAGGSSNDIWSHRWNLNSADYYGYSDGAAYVTNDLCPSPASTYIIVNDYVIQPETLWGGMQTMGVFAHEYGHALGLPDLYDTDNSSEGIGYWGLMGSGSWNYVTRAGDSPAHLSAWSKLTLGWINPTEVNGTLVNETIDQASSSSDVYLLQTTNPAEYYLVENRQLSGFDAGLPGSGLAIWHIDENKSNNTEECEFVSDCTSTHYKVALVQADGNWHLEKKSNRGDTNDMWHQGIAASFNALSNPSSNLYNSDSSFVSVTDISSSSASMTATLNTPAQNIIFSEDFESGSLGSYWSTTSTHDGRIQVTTDDDSFRGNYHVTMDDSVDSGSSSLNELILTIDLTGETGVILSFFQKDFIDEDHTMPTSFSGSKNYDGVAVSADGSTWYKAQGLTYAEGSTNYYKGFMVDLDALIASAGISYNSTFMIKFQQYDNYTIPTDGFAFDDITITADSPNDPVPGAVTPSNNSSGGFTDSSFDLTTLFTDSIDDVTTCEYCKSTDGTCDTEWTSANLTGSSPAWSCYQTGITGTDGEVLTLNMRATNSSSTAEATAITVTVDDTAPSTSNNAPSSWSATSPLSVTLTPDDGTGSGAAVTSYCVDTTDSCTPVTTGTSADISCSDGSECLQYLRYSSSDNVGNQETTNTILIRHDRKSPDNGSLSVSSGTEQVSLSWSGFSDSASGLHATDAYKLVYSTAASPDIFCSTGTEITDVTTGTTYLHSGITGGLSYYYRLCAIDNAGNISSGATAEATPASVQFMLTTAASPVGSGSITPDYSGGQLIDSGTMVVLTANETSGYPFVEWVGCDSASNNICTMTMDADKTLTATFDDTPLRNMRTLEYYSNLQDAYDAAQDGDTIQCRIAVLSDNITADRNISFTLSGGYNSDYSAVTGRTGFNGLMTVSDGTVTIGNFIFE